MKPTHQEPPNEPAQDTGDYDKLPDKTKSLLNLEDQITKTTGPESAALQKTARENSSEDQPTAT